jgi:hypothetical protein
LLDIFGSTTTQIVITQMLNDFRDAGITLSCHLSDLFNSESPLTKALLPSGRPAQCQILELGTGCGMVGITIAQLLPGAEVRLTDLPEAQEIVKRNIHRAQPAEGSSLEFQTLDWDAELPLDLQRPTSPMDLVIAADCTYNSDSRYDMCKSSWHWPTLT